MAQNATKSSSSSSSSTSSPAPSPPAEFRKIIDDFTSDLVGTFPEYAPMITKWWTAETGVSEERRAKETLLVFRHCMRVFPERFFDILYKNEELFAESSTSEANTEFLPGIVFKQLWRANISDSTRDAIWNYLQLVLMTIVTSINSQKEFGNTAYLFEAIDENELKAKLEQTMEQMQQMFEGNREKRRREAKEKQRKERRRRGAAVEEEKSDSDDDDDTSDDETSGGSGGGLFPNVEELHEHLQSMMSGKLGRLAVELAQETAGEFGFDEAAAAAGMGGTAGGEGEAAKAQEMFQKLFQNPGKLMDLVKSMGSKINEKIRAGEISESEIMEEAMAMASKMQNMPGMGEMGKMFSKMGLGKAGAGAFETHVKRESKMAKMKEKLRERAAQKMAQKMMAEAMAAAATAASVESTAAPAALSDDKLAALFAAPAQPNGSSKKDKDSKKKGKKNGGGGK